MKSVLPTELADKSTIAFIELPAKCKRDCFIERLYASFSNRLTRFLGNVASNKFLLSDSSFP